MAAATFSTLTLAPFIAASFIWRRTGRSWWCAASSVFRCWADRRLGNGKAEFSTPSALGNARLCPTRGCALWGFAGTSLPWLPRGQRRCIRIRHAGRGQQDAGGRLGGTRHAGIAADQRRDNGTFHQNRHLSSQAVRIRDLHLRQRIAQPEPPLFLMGDADLGTGVRRVAQLRDGVDERTSAKSVARKPTFEPVEIAKNLLEQRPIGRLGLDEVAGEIRDDQLVLRRKIVVERAFADADLRRDGVDADGADASAVEQAPRGVENPLLHGLLGGPTAHDCTGLCNFCLTGGMVDVLLTPTCVVKCVHAKE